MNYPPLSLRPLSFRRSRLLIAAALAALALPAAAAPILSRTAAGPQRLPGHLPRAVLAQSRLVGRVASGETVSLALTLPLRNRAALNTLLQRLYAPGDPLRGRFLTPAEFTSRFGPTAADYAAVAAWAARAGFAVTGTHPNRLILDVSGPASRVETAFGLRLMRYRSARGRAFFAPDADPALPAVLAGRVAQVIGLDSATPLRPHLARRPLRPAVLGERDGTGPQGGLAPSDVATAYGLTGSNTAGAGQTLALFELDGYTASDIAAYESAFGLPAVTLQNVLVDQTSGAPGSGADEVTLDIELAQALAPGLSRIMVYETPNVTDQNYLDAYDRIATDDIAEQVSSSWGGAEGQSDASLISAEDPIFEQMAAQGQSMIAVTGDTGAYDGDPNAVGSYTALSVDDPGSQPYVTGIGGTTLSTAGIGGAYAGETAWGDPTDTRNSPRGAGGGGGFSAVWPTPAYQTALPTVPATRSVPDVALDADPNTGYSIFYQGAWNVYGGTSAAAPLWAGFAARVNQARAAAGESPIGFLNPAIYHIGGSSAYGTDFHDVTTGTNLYYPAAPGYDNATGWGSFVGDALLGTLVSGLSAPTGTAAAHTFPAGLQMISAPGSFAGFGDFAALFGFSAPLSSAQAAFVRWSPTLDVYTFSPSYPADTFYPGQGYWARFAAPATLHQSGTPVSTASAFPLGLFAGWNQIGDPFPSPVALSALTTTGGYPLASSAAVSPTLFGYNPATGAYVALSPATDSLQPYVGYWVYANQSTTLSVPAP